MKQLIFVSVVYILSVVAPNTLLATDGQQGFVHGKITDRTGAPLRNVVLILETAAPPDSNDSAPSRLWVRVGDHGTFESVLPSDFTILGVLPACYDVVNLRRTAGGLELVLSTLDSTADTLGAHRSAGSTTDFASAAPSAVSAGPSWSGAHGLVPTLAFMQAPVIGTAAVVQIAAGVARGPVSSLTGLSMPSTDSFRWFTTSTALSSLGTYRTAGLSNFQSSIFGTQALSAFGRTLGVSDPLVGLGRTTWNTSTTYSSFYSPITRSQGVNTNLNTSLGRSWTTWTGSTGAPSTWRPPKGIQATPTPNCERWNQTRPESSRARQDGHD